MKGVDAQEGGELCYQIKSNSKNTRIYTGSVYLTYVQFSTTQVEFHYPQVLQTGSPGTFTTASFRPRSLATLQPQVLHRFTCNLTDLLPLTTCKGSTFTNKGFSNLSSL